MTIISTSNLCRSVAALFVLSLFVACDESEPSDGSNNSADAHEADGPGSTDSGSGAGDADSTAPKVTTTSPINAAMEVPLNASVSVTFDHDMDRASLNAATFTLKTGTTTISGTVIYGGRTAVFRPSARLTTGPYTATITTGVKSSTGVALAANHVWTFATGSNVAATLAVNLATAGTYAILAKSAISTVPPSAVTGNIAVSPSAATFITNFSLVADPTNVFSTSTQVTGKVFAANYAVPTPSNLTTAVGDMELAFTNAAGRSADVTELGAGDIGGKTLAPGVYSWGTGLLIPSDVKLNGNATDVWIFQVAQNLTMSSAKSITLIGGALAKNVFWQVSGFVEIGTTAHFEGIVLSQTSISLRTGATINGRLLAQTAVVLQSATVVAPAQ